MQFSLFQFTGNRFLFCFVFFKCLPLNTTLKSAPLRSEALENYAVLKWYGLLFFKMLFVDVNTVSD